jgi:hypothetical protein
LGVAAVVLVGCERSTVTSPPAPKPPVDTAQQDALWALAPDGADAGFVMSSRGIRMLESGALAVRQLFSIAPELALMAAKMDAELTRVFGTANIVLADIGLAPGKGTAAFGLPDGGVIVILPVADRDKFLAAAKGARGTDVDTLRKGFTCKTVRDFYACASSPALFDRIGKAGMKGRSRSPVRAATSSTQRRSRPSNSRPSRNWVAAPCCSAGP